MTCLKHYQVRGSLSTMRTPMLCTETVERGRYNTITQRTRECVCVCVSVWFRRIYIGLTYLQLPISPVLQMLAFCLHVFILICVHVSVCVCVCVACVYSKCVLYMPSLPDCFTGDVPMCVYVACVCVCTCVFVCVHVCLCVCECVCVLNAHF